MHYRHLKPELVRFLESVSDDGLIRWPKYRSLGRYARRNRWVFSEREYSRLKRVHVAREEIVVTLIQYLHDVESPALVREFPEFDTTGLDANLETLTELTDGKALRRRDYIRGTSWRELALLHVLRDDDGEEESFCREEEMARKVARSQYLEMARALVPSRYRNREEVVLAALEDQISQSVEVFEELMVGFWREIPESIWLTLKRGKPIGGSIVIPLTVEAYEKLSQGELSDLDLSSERDLQIPSRNLWVVALTTFPEVAKPRLPGVHTARQMRKFCQNIAVLLGRDAPQQDPVRMLAITDDNQATQAIQRFGFKRLPHTLCGSNSPLFESVIPPPESTIADFTSAAATWATIVGTAWRLLRRD